MSQILLQSDNSLLIGGCFLTMNGISTPGVARITSAGQVDSSFGSKLGTGFNGCVRAMLSMPDGTVLALGDFTSLNGVNANGIALLGAQVAVTTTTIASNQRSLPSTGSISAAWIAMALIVLASGVLIRQRRTDI
jgi:LPXTG-motif cell wall-anchored protein